MYAIQYRCMSIKVDVSRTKLINVIFEFVLLRITIIYLTKHRCMHVRNFVREKHPYSTDKGNRGVNHVCTLRCLLSNKKALFFRFTSKISGTSDL